MDDNLEEVNFLSIFRLCHNFLLHAVEGLFANVHYSITPLITRFFLQREVFIQETTLQCFDLLSLVINARLVGARMLEKNTKGVAFVLSFSPW